MPSRIIFIPIEPYASRYTQYTSVLNGVIETCIKATGVELLTIRPDNHLRDIKYGQVLDVCSRTKWAFEQIQILVEMIMKGQVNPKEDVIYLEDFFTPGFAMLMYAQSSKFGPNHREHAKIYSFCHAQSFDPYDFTHRWAWWMRPLEHVWFEYQEGIFCASRHMIPLIADAGIPIIRDRRYKVIPIGHWFHKEVMLKIAGVENYCWETFAARKKQVVYSARWDTEKNPGFFMDLMELVLAERDDINFVICTGQHRLDSTDEKLISRLGSLFSWHSPKISILTGLSLNRYYTILMDSKVQFNCSLQDWISYTLLDSTINGCAPLYPRWLSFPDALNDSKIHLYNNMDLKDAKDKLYALIDSEDNIDVSWVYKKYIDTGKNAIRHMGFQV